MPSQYLQGADLAAYGVATVTAAQVVAASTLIDNYIGRPEGLVWQPDADGMPCYMAALTPQMSATVGGAGIAPGKGVVMTCPLLAAFPDIVGQVVVLDRANTGLCEAAAVTASDRGAGTVTLATVARPHANGATAEVGLSIFEERPLAPKRSIARVSRKPVVNLQSGIGRYGYGRRSDQAAGLYNDVNLLATIQSFGGPPQWIPFDVTACSYSAATNEVWVPAGLLLAYYSEVRLQYIAGWSAAALPPAVKQACANILNFLVKYPQMSGAITEMGSKTGLGTDGPVKRAKPTAIDDDTKALLEPFQINRFA